MGQQQARGKGGSKSPDPGRVGRNDGEAEGASGIPGGS